MRIYGAAVDQEVAGSSTNRLIPCSSHHTSKCSGCQGRQADRCFLLVIIAAQNVQLNFWRTKKIPSWYPVRNPVRTDWSSRPLRWRSLDKKLCERRAGSYLLLQKEVKRTEGSSSWGAGRRALSAPFPNDVSIVHRPLLMVCVRLSVSIRIKNSWGFLHL